MERQMQPNEILKRPYARVLTPESDGHYAAEIMEFPNCIATGETAAQALANLEQVAADWVAAALEQGQDIPDAMETAEYSGRLVLRMTRGLHRRAALLAEREGVSLNQFINTCLAECVGEKSKSQFLHAVPQVHAVTDFAEVKPTDGRKSKRKKA
jgi:predicted RNase H-like HicB family nuclease